MENVVEERQQQRELATKSHLLELQNELNAHQALTLKEMLSQKEPVDRLFSLSQRYAALTKTPPSNQKQQKLVAATPTLAEDFLQQEFNAKIKLLQASCSRMSQSYETLKPSYQIFRNLCDELDMSTKSPFVQGDSHHKPIDFFVEHVGDFMRFYNNLQTKFRYYTKLLDIEETKSLKNYKSLLLAPSKCFEEELRGALAYMKCLRARHPISG